MIWKLFVVFLVVSTLGVFCFAEKNEMRHGWVIFSGPKKTSGGAIDKTALQEGEKIYIKNCAKCHGPKGRGDGPIAKSTGVKPASLKKAGRIFPESYLIVQINQGKKNMPKWKDVLSPKEVSDLSHYIKVMLKE